MLLTIPGIAVQAATPSPDAVRPGSENLVLQYRAHWRVWTAGFVTLNIYPPASDEVAHWQAGVAARTTGFVDTLFAVDNRYTVQFDRDFCADSYLFHLKEGQRRRRISVTYQDPPGEVNYLERDLVNGTFATKHLRTPHCVHDELAALAKLRTLPLETGETLRFPVSNGKKYAMVRVQILGRGKVSTPSGTYDAIQCEVFLLNNVLYKRQGRLLIWLTDDERRIPVQVRFKLPFYLGTVTLELIKEQAT